jgi:CheY-like chemotaxis protein
MNMPVKGLVVDDDEFVRGILVRNIAAAGVTTVLTAADADEALRRLRQHRDCAFVVCDLDMPGADGGELLVSMGEQNPGLRAVLISALPELVLKKAERIARDAGLQVLGALPKPVDRQRLITLLASSAPA